VAVGIGPEFKPQYCPPCKILPPKKRLRKKSLPFWTYILIKKGKINKQNTSVPDGDSSRKEKMQGRGIRMSWERN
jgi:hypothetical protein